MTEFDVLAPPKAAQLPILAPKWALDSPSDREAALAVCEAIAFGRSMADIERDPALPPRDLFISWLMRDPSLALAFHRAREMSSYVLEDEALELLRGRLTNPGSSVEIRAADLFVQQLRWSAGKRNPGVYSDKAAVSVTVPVQINTTLDMGPAGPGTGTKEFPNIYELKAELVQELDLPDADEVRSPDLIEPPPAPRLRSKTKKRILIPKARAAETAAERDERLRKTKLAMEERASRELTKKKRRLEQAEYQNRKRREETVRLNARDPQR